METEIWRDIKDYEGLYQVSNLGRVKSLTHKNETRRFEGKILKPHYNLKGYQKVGLYNGTHRSKKQVLVSRLVASAFIPNPLNLPCVNHRDEVKDNNVLTNLEWCTYSYNNSYGTKPQVMSEHMSKPIIQIKPINKHTGLITNIYASANIAAKENNYDVTGIRHCASKDTNTSYGYKWRYLSDLRTANAK